MVAISAKDLKDNIENHFIVDIREQYEYDFANLGNKHIPMGELQNRMEELPTDKIIVLMCKSGKRAQALANLLDTGLKFKNVTFLDGGIESWKEIMNPQLIIE